MLQGDVQGVEVVPAVLDLGALGHHEPQPAHDVLQLLGRLRDRVQVAQAKSPAGHGRVEVRWRERSRASETRLSCPQLARVGDACPFGQLLGGSLSSGLDLPFDQVEPLPGGRLVGLVDLAQPLLDCF